MLEAGLPHGTAGTDHLRLLGIGVVLGGRIEDVGVEALASGCPAAVTRGSDTGNLVEPDTSGAVAEGREPDALADAMERAARCGPDAAAAAVADLGAAAVVSRLYDLTTA